MTTDLTFLQALGFLVDRASVPASFGLHLAGTTEIEYSRENGIVLSRNNQ